MSPIGESTFVVPRDDGRAEPVARRSVQRVGSGLACEEGESFKSWYCPRDDTVVHVPLTCSEARLCPRCSRRWAFKEARKAAWRLSHVQKRKVYGNVPPRHVVVSFAEGQGEELTVAGYDVLFTRAWAVLKTMGSRGGVGLVHPWRHWKPGDYGDVRSVDLWAPGPHYHFLVWGWLDLEVQPEGAFVRVLRSEQETVVGTLGYLLDHCGVVERKHALRWYGVASYNGCSGVPPLPREVTVPLCPLCGGDMTELDLVDWTYGGRPEGVPFDGWRALGEGLGNGCGVNASRGGAASDELVSESVNGNVPSAVRRALRYPEGGSKAVKGHFPKGSVGSLGLQGREDVPDKEVF